MNAGLLDRLIEIQSVIQTRTSSGQVSITYERFKRCYAQRINILGKRENVINSKETVIFDAVYRIRYISNLKNNMRLIDGNEIFDIKTIVPIGRKIGLDLSCQTIQE